MKNIGRALLLASIAVLGPGCAVEVEDDGFDELGDQPMEPVEQVAGGLEQLTWIDSEVGADSEVGELDVAAPDASWEVAFATASLLGNGSFELASGGVDVNGDGVIQERERDPTVWQESAGSAPGSYFGALETRAHLFRSANAARAGSYGLRITSPSPLGGWAVAMQSIQAMPGRSYTVSARTRLRSGDQQFMIVAIAFDTGYSYARVPTGWSTSWHTLSRTFTAPPGAKWIIVQLGDGGDQAYGSTHDWDVIRLVAN